MASWIYSLARNRATNRDESNQDYSSQVQGNQDQHSQEQRAESAENQELRAKNAENQELRTKLRAMEAQVLEMAMLMLTLKSNGTNENATAAAAGANHENGPSVTSEPAQIIFTESHERVGVHHVPNLVATPEIPLGFDSPVIASQDHPAAAPQERDKYQCLEEMLRTNARWMMTRDPSLVPNEIPSPVFKLPEFVKFEGMTCPVLHVDMYYKKMLPLTENEGVLVYHFQNSLAGEALRWYMQLEHAHIMSLKELACAFLKRFKYNLGMDPDRMQLQHMAQRSKETFREYTHRWRDLAAQARPPLLEEEMVDIFMNTLPPLYYDQLIRSAPSNFKDLVLAGESLENGANKGKTAYSSTETTPITRSGNVSYSSKILSQIPHSSTQARKSQKTPNYPEKKPEPFDPIPMSYSDLFDHLTSHDIISPRLVRPIQPPFPEGYDPDAMCKFHAGTVGHSIEDCKALKHVIQDLIDSK